jgi:hypothetical protein
MEYTTEELELLDAIESDNVERVPFDNEEIKSIAKKQYKIKKNK